MKANKLKAIIYSVSLVGVSYVVLATCGAAYGNYSYYCRYTGVTHPTTITKPTGVDGYIVYTGCIFDPTTFANEDILTTYPVFNGGAYDFGGPASTCNADIQCNAPGSGAATHLGLVNCSNVTDGGYLMQKDGNCPGSGSGSGH